MFGSHKVLKKRKKNVKKNIYIFFIYGFTKENRKENKISL